MFKYVHSFPGKERTGEVVTIAPDHHSAKRAVVDELAKRGLAVKTRQLVQVSRTPFAGGVAHVDEGVRSRNCYHSDTCDCRRVYSQRKGVAKG